MYKLHKYTVITLGVILRKCSMNVLIMSVVFMILLKILRVSDMTNDLMIFHLVSVCIEFDFLAIKFENWTNYLLCFWFLVNLCQLMCIWGWFLFVCALSLCMKTELWINWLRDSHSITRLKSELLCQKKIFKLKGLINSLNDYIEFGKKTNLS